MTDISKLMSPITYFIVLLNTEWTVLHYSDVGYICICILGTHSSHSSTRRLGLGIYIVELKHYQDR